MPSFLSLFKGLGTLLETHHMQLQDDARPFALSSPCRMAIPLHQMTKEKLQRIERLGVISPMEEPTPWCAPIVVVPKPNGAVRLCIDFTELNRYVPRDWHPIPSVEHTLELLQGARYFYKLDANPSFWQIPPSEDCKCLTIFFSPFARFCFN